MATANRTRSTHEIASEIASLLEAAAINQGPGKLTHHDAQVALNMFGNRGFSLWNGPLPEPRAAVPLAPLPALARVAEVFDLATQPGVSPALSGQILAALLPQAIDALALQVWDEFLAIKRRLQQP
ncbi:hypothetical protein D3C71_1253920 [compost metagenome]